MDKRTLEALNASIAAWEIKLQEEDPEDVEMGVRSCPLCMQFWHDDCEGCPVAKRTGQISCDETPFYKANDRLVFWRDYGPEDESRRDAFREACRAEIDFLKSLLPEPVDTLQTGC